MNHHNPHVSAAVSGGSSAENSSSEHRSPQLPSAEHPSSQLPASAQSDSYQLASAVVAELARYTDHVVLAPGSRSAPMAYALAQAQEQGLLEVHIRIDERSAAFTALGLAMARGGIAVVVTTSGTATGNLTPAMMEADMAGVKLLAMTADRPTALHGTGANQTTLQQGMFASRVRGELHLEQGSHQPGDQLSRDVTGLLDLMSGIDSAAAAAAARGPGPGPGLDPAPGPGHLNIGFADPLTPRQHTSWQIHSDAADASSPLEANSDMVSEQAQDSSAEQFETGRQLETSDQGDPLGEHAAPSQGVSLEQGAFPELGASVALPAELPERTGGVVVLGHDAPDHALEWASRLGHPVFAEPSSGIARHPLLADLVVPSYRLLIPRPPACIQRVLAAGRPTLSREIQQLLAAADIEVIQFEQTPEPWHDDRLPRKVSADLAELAQWLGTGSQQWLHSWRAAGAQAHAQVQEVLKTTDQEHGQLNSVRAASWLIQHRRNTVFLGSSSVIRDVDLATDFAQQSAAGSAAIYANRGLAGIDGNIATAAGISLASGSPVTALLGDLTALHDANGLLFPSTERVPDLDVIVVNDAGGAIFDRLEHGEVARQQGAAGRVERFFGTPQQVEIAALARGYGHQYHQVRGLEELEDLVASRASSSGIRVIEIRTDRSRLNEIYQRIRLVVSALAE